MKVSKTPLEGLLVIDLDVYRDTRGHFTEAWNILRYEECGIKNKFVQENVSRSRKGVLRGLHFQEPFPQAKLVQVLNGSAFDVAIDLRKQSPTFGKWWGTNLSADNGRQLFIPEGFAHGFLATEEDTVFFYRCSEYYHPEAEHTLLWNDSEIAIEWPMGNPELSAKDLAGMTLSHWATIISSNEFGGTV